MISPAKQRVIQIETTNACPRRCSNCTRFVGHHKKPFMMDIETFKKAIDSLKGYNGTVGIMGGEPTIHPDFETIVTYAKNARPEVMKMPAERYQAMRDFGKYSNDNTGRLEGRRLGLWSSLGDGYYKHFELIQDTFGYQCLNDHSHRGEHLALMLTRKELGITDQEWPQYRDNCWVQREWSASITPKGAFFCEVAAALDMLYDGPGGWPVEPGWWKREPKDFGDQLQWCELCSACLPVPRAVASESKDYASPEHVARLEAIQSPKLASGGVVPINPAEYQRGAYSVNQSCEPYLDPDTGKSCRIHPSNRSTKPRNLKIFTVCVGYDDYLDISLSRNKRQMSGNVEMIVVTDDQDQRTKDVCAKHGIRCVVSPRIHINKAPFAKGKAVNDAFDIIKPNDWVLMTDADVIFTDGLIENIMDMTLNPGALYYTRRWGPDKTEDIPRILHDFDGGMSTEELFSIYATKRVAEKRHRIANDIEAFPYGYFQLFNIQAQSLRGRIKLYPENRGTAEMDDSDFGLVVFPSSKRAKLPSPDFDVIHLPHGAFKQNWDGRKSPRITEA